LRRLSIVAAKPVPGWREAASGKLFVGFQQNIRMAKAKDPNKAAADAPGAPNRGVHDSHNARDAHDDPNTRGARLEAEKDILGDPELSDDDPTDDLDEAELAQRDNSDEDALDALEKERPAKPHTHPAKPHPHSGKGKEK
jgi:hypothetical protein